MILSFRLPLQCSPGNFRKTHSGHIADSCSQRIQEIEQTARSRMEQTVCQMAQDQGVTEDLKAADPMKWVGLMNNIRASVEEQILQELIYA